MTNLRKSIEAAAGTEKIIGTVIGRHYRYTYDKVHDPTSADKMGVVLTWEDAAPILDYEYDSGFGGADCHPVFVWTTTRVLFVHEYDGATSIVSVPRNPQACWPDFSGEDCNDET